MADPIRIAVGRIERDSSFDEAFEFRLERPELPDRLVDVSQTEINDADTAARLGMHGSPTVLIDGRDAVTSDASAGSLSCRLYTPAGGGGRQGAPSVDQLTEALTRKEPPGDSGTRP